MTKIEHLNEFKEFKESYRCRCTEIDEYMEYISMAQCVLKHKHFSSTLKAF